VSSMINHSRSLLAGIALVGLVGLGACSDDKGNDAAPSDTTAEDSGTTETTTGGEAIDCTASPGETVTVEIGDFEFIPDRVQVNACDEIVWSNTHNQSHTSTGNGDFSWSTGNIAAGSEGDPVVFDTPGEFAYMCALHPFMKGTVEVS